VVHQDGVYGVAFAADDELREALDLEDRLAVGDTVILTENDSNDSNYSVNP
jgi:hypothetical protein